MAPKAEARNRYIPGRCSAFRQPIFLVLPPGVLGRDSPFKIGPLGIESLGSFILLPLRRIKRRLGFRDLLLALGALLFRILNLAADKDSLFAAILLRHDCVHRSGCDKDGQELKVFTKAFVQHTAGLIRDLVQSIERAVRARRSPPGTTP
jgi:hypothetical protein